MQRIAVLLALVCSVPLPARAAATAKVFNPDIGANILGLVQKDSRGSADLGTNNRTDGLHNGISLQEAELQASADVDPYFRASMLLSISQKDGTTEYKLDPEEVYLETISLPVVTLRAGKFFAAMGKHNQLHTHAFPFIDAPLISQDLLGGDGLNEPGVSAAVLIPAPWFLELTAQALATNSAALFKSDNSSDVAGVGSLKNLWELSDDTTLEASVFGTSGSNQYFSHSTAWGSDLILKWRPAVGGKYQALIWQTEYLSGNRLGGPAPKLSGIATWLQYQFAERWWVEAREQYEGFGPMDPSLPIKRMQSVLLGLFPSEFSGFRLQGDHLLSDSQRKDEYRVAFQVNISIGAHPAHAY